MPIVLANIALVAIFLIAQWALVLLLPPLGDGWDGGPLWWQRAGSLPRAAGRDMRPAAQSLFFASPKESNQKKGDPAVRVPSLRYGQPVVLTAGGSAQTRLRLKQCAALIRLQLRSSARPEGRGR